MRVTNINDTTFGTRLTIGDIAASNGLRKYKINLTNGILSAFNELSKNGTQDELCFLMGRRAGAKKLNTDIIELSLYTNVPNSIGRLDGLNLKSSLTLNPKTLQKYSGKQISKIILESYEKLKKSNKTTNAIGYYTSKPTKKVSKKHAQKIKELVSKYGFDDFTCA